MMMMSVLFLFLLGVCLGVLLAAGCLWKIFAVLCSTERGACETIATLLRAFSAKLPADTAVVVNVSGQFVEVPIELIASSIEEGALRVGRTPTEPNDLN